MGRRNRREPIPEPGELRVGGFRKSETHSDGEWIVQSITGSTSVKSYRCPGCDMEIKPATPHIVAWPIDAVDDRRHWHSVCWTKKDHRRPSGK